MARPTRVSLRSRTLLLAAALVLLPLAPVAAATNWSLLVALQCGSVAFECAGVVDGGTSTPGVTCAHTITVDRTTTMFCQPDEVALDWSCDYRYVQVQTIAAPAATVTPNAFCAGGGDSAICTASGETGWCTSDTYAATPVLFPQVGCRVDWTAGVQWWYSFCGLTVRSG